MSEISNSAGVALLLEDEALIALDIEGTLKDEGYAVVVLSTCAAARDWLAGNTPAIAVIDVRLKDGPCNDVAMLLTARGVPFVVHSTSLIGGSEAHADFSAGVWLDKPSLATDMIVSIAKAVGPGRA